MCSTPSNRTDRMNLLNNSILQQGPSNSVMVDGRLIVSICAAVFKLPSVLAFVVQKFWIVVSFIQKLEHRRQDFR